MVFLCPGIDRYLYIMQININNPKYVSVHSGGVGSTAHSVTLKIPLSLMKLNARDYLKDARSLVNKWKNEGYNAIGINAKLAALIIEVVGNDYTGGIVTHETELDA